MSRDVSARTGRTAARARRQWCSARLACLVLALAPAWAASAELRFIGEAVLPTGSRFAGTEVGGLSGIDYDARNDAYLAISDDGSRRSPARFYRIDIDLADGRLDDDDVRIRSVVGLLDAGRAAFAPGTTDPEAIRLHRASGLVYWADEGNARAGIGPALIEADADGSQLRSYALPAYYRPGDGQGVRFNKAFESLALSDDGRELLVALENALAQDGPRADLEQGSPVRVLRIDRASGRPLGETLYLTEPVPHDSRVPFRAPDNGLVELLAIDADRLLAVERAFAAGVGVTLRLFETRIEGASDVLGQPALGDAGEIRYMPKRLLYDLAVLGLRLDNIEGVTFGPVLPNGRRALILVSDNNFRESQFTQFLAFEVDLGGPPASISAD